MYCVYCIVLYCVFQCVGGVGVGVRKGGLLRSIVVCSAGFGVKSINLVQIVDTKLPQFGYGRYL